MANLSPEEQKQLADGMVDALNSASDADRKAFFDGLRSEERRVGKECRSLCDWSSDVCSSDLHGESQPGGAETARRRHGRRAQLGIGRGPQGVFRRLEIGRASCRERV